MTEKTPKNQALARRAPRQARALHKVGLILEATQRLLEEGDIAALTTNAIASTAGVSIGTLYQYFDDKDAILEALTERELGGLAERVAQVLQGPPPDAPGGRVPLLVHAVLDAYGGRRRVHRLLMDHALGRGAGGRLNPLYEMLRGLVAGQGIAAPGRAVVKLAPADAFVLTHAVAGVLRGAVAMASPPPRAALEAALTRLILGFVRLEDPAVR